MSTIIGLDPGFGNIKAAYLNGQLKSTSLTSVVGIGEKDLGLLTHMNGARRRRRPDIIEFDNYRYLVGEKVADFARPIERMDFLRLAEGNELRALVYTTLHHLLGSGTHADLRLMVGLPVEIMLNRKEALNTRRTLRGTLVGEHTFCVNGRESTLEVTRLEVLAQPAGSYFHFLMDTNGQPTRARESFSGSIAICDIGFNTLDLMAFKGGQIQARQTAGQTAGMRRACELLITQIQRRAGITLSLHEADDLLRDNDPTLQTIEGEIDLTTLVEQARSGLASEILTLTERHWGNARQFRHLLFTGGGAEALRGELGRHYPHAVILPDAVTANACGFVKYGQRTLAP